MIYNLKHKKKSPNICIPHCSLHLFSGALISTWVVLSQMARCHFALTRSDDVFFFFNQHFLIVFYYFQQTDNKGGIDNISLHIAHKALR